MEIIGLIFLDIGDGDVLDIGDEDFLLIGVREGNKFFNSIVSDEVFYDSVAADEINFNSTVS